MEEYLAQKYGNFTAAKKKDFAQTYRELSEEYPVIKILFIIGIACLIYSGINEFNFQTKYAPQPRYNLAEQNIDVLKEPLQTEPPSAKPFIFTAANGAKYRIVPMADYDISAMVVAKNTNVWLRGLMNSSFDNVALIDFGLLCGQVANEDTLEHIRFRSKKILSSARELRPMPAYGTSWRDVDSYLQSKGLSLDYFSSHMSHVHVIPSNDNVMSALMKLKKKDIVRFEGYLVDLDINGSTLRTSLSRTDTNPTSRGNGACEIMYVKKVQLKDKVYE